MTSVVNQKFALKPVVAALALATAAGAAYAAPTPNQMPGAGDVTNVSLGSTTALGPIIDLVNPTTITVDGKVVIKWGNPASAESKNPFGFNLGSNAALFFTGKTATSAVLNIDISGNPSQIFGRLEAEPSAGFAPAMFVSNANGIVVGASGRIVAPAGLGLIGANMDNAKSINEFVGNNGWVIPAAPAYGVSYISYAGSQVTTKSNVEINGAINGDYTKNLPAKYVLLAGNNISVMNTGNVFGLNITVDAGIVATGSLDAVNGLSNQQVQRLWNVDAGAEVAQSTVGPGPLEFSLIGGAVTGNFLNEGSVSAAGTGVGEWIAIQAAGNVRSGISGNTDVLKGFFSDQGIFVDSYSNTSTIELYNVVSGYTTNKVLPFLEVGYLASVSTPSFRPDVTINAITPGLQPSSITTTDDIAFAIPPKTSVMIYGGNVNILSTINHKLNSAGGVAGDYDLVINGSKSVNIGAAVGAGAEVRITSNGPLTIPGDVTSDTKSGGPYGGGIYIANIAAGASTTISGHVLVPAGASYGDLNVSTLGPTTISGSSLINDSYDVNITNNGQGAGNFTTIDGKVHAYGSVFITQAVSPANAPITITETGDVSANDDVTIANLGASAGNTTVIAGQVSAGDQVNLLNAGLQTGLLTVSGQVTGYDVTMVSDGNANLGGIAITATHDIFGIIGGTSLHVDGPWQAGNYVNITSPLALAKFNPYGTLMAPTIALTGVSFQGVDSSWMPYATLGDKPSWQFMTNTLGVVLTGSINAPLAPPAPDKVGAAAVTPNWLNNSLDIAPLFPLAPVAVSVTANGAGFQAVNLRVLGDMIANSGATTTPFIGVPLSSGGLPAGGLQGNLGSQLILQADGYMQVWGTPTLSLFGPLLAFQWPGGAVFKAGTTLQTFAPIYNAWSTESPAFGGLFFEAPYISLGGYLAVSGTAWANFSTQPVGGDPTVFQIRKLSDTAFGFEATDKFVKNAYSNTVTGGFVCSTTGPTTWVACP